jgi:hypothetical protein
VRVWLDGMPENIAEEIDASGLQLQLIDIAAAPLDAAHIFVIEVPTLTRTPLLNRNGFIWVSWPKKAAKVPTDITEDVIQDVALPMHFVDVKVCSVDDIWPGQKLVIRKEHR